MQYLVRRRDDFRGKRVVIAGGGDSAVDWALSLRDVAEKVYVVHRRAKFRAAPETAAQLEAAAATGELELVIPYQLHGAARRRRAADRRRGRDLSGDDTDAAGGPAAAVLRPVDGPRPDRRLGPRPASTATSRVDPATCQTSTPGVFAIGDVATYPGKLKLILQGFSEGAVAAHAIHPIVYPDTALHFEYSTTKGVPAGVAPWTRSRSKG